MISTTNWRGWCGLQQGGSPLLPVSSYLGSLDVTEREPVGSVLCSYLSSLNFWLTLRVSSFVLLVCLLWVEVWVEVWREWSCCPRLVFERPESFLNLVKFNTICWLWSDKWAKCSETTRLDGRRVPAYCTYVHYTYQHTNRAMLESSRLEIDYRRLPVAGARRGVATLQARYT